MSDTVWIAELDTSHYSFVAVGTTPGAAEASLWMGVRKHCKQTGLPWLHMRDSYDDAVNTYEVPFGGCARDGSVL
jgi:hypothetical protein